MTTRDFCFWLQGYFEVNDSTVEGTRSFASNTLNEGQVKMIRQHLNLVFTHDPSISPPPQKPLTELERLADSMKTSIC